MFNAVSPRARGCQRYGLAMLIMTSCVHAPAESGSIVSEIMTFDYPFSYRLSRPESLVHNYVVPISEANLPMNLDCQLLLSRGAASLSLKVYDPLACSTIDKAPVCQTRPETGRISLVCRIEQKSRYYIAVSLLPEAAEAEFKLVCGAVKIKSMESDKVAPTAPPVPVPGPAHDPPAGKSPAKLDAKSRPASSTDSPPKTDSGHSASDPRSSQGRPQPTAVPTPINAKPEVVPAAKLSATKVKITYFPTLDADKTSGSDTILVKLNIKPDEQFNKNLTCVPQTSGVLTVENRSIRVTVLQSFAAGGCKIQADWIGVAPNTAKTYDLTFTK